MFSLNTPGTHKRRLAAGSRQPYSTAGRSGEHGQLDLWRLINVRCLGRRIPRYAISKRLRNARYTEPDASRADRRTNTASCRCHYVSHAGLIPKEPPAIPISMAPRSAASRRDGAMSDEGQIGGALRRVREHCQQFVRRRVTTPPLG